MDKVRTQLKKGNPGYLDSPGLSMRLACTLNVVQVSLEQSLSIDDQTQDKTTNKN